MITKYDPADPGRTRVRSLEDCLRNLYEYLLFDRISKLIGVYVPPEADRLERRAYEVEGLIHSVAAKVLGAEFLFYQMGAEEEDEYLLRLPVGNLVSERGVQVFLVAYWDIEYGGFYFEVIRCLSLVDEVEATIFGCATSALVDFYIDRLPFGSGGTAGERR